MRVGLMGGTFDPIHNAHLHIAKMAYDAMRFDEVLFIPVGNPPHKRLNANAEDRLRMVELAVKNIPWAKPLATEARRSGMTYTVDTLTELHAQRPQDAFYYIVGTDALRDMPLWRSAARTMELCELVAVTRPGYDEKALSDAKAAAEERTGARVHIVHDLDGLAISSTQVRDAAAAGAGIKDLVPDAVAAYIRERGLYQSK